ncbi:calcium/sodium antiporter [Oceanobacillus massiliensis]|uniref:calcium/sodium antiporter n=1 Tax=Oceanobacillus massiliensis TaxID=1465765 RepID=UPI0002892653|nr:calcium/sodium antiporter [Oceanobacillus massiliensis]
MAYILLILGFALLIKGADWFVDGSSNIAALLRVSPLLIGLTIVAFGTSSPELTVSIIAALEGSADVSLGNVVGSNIFNITLVVGMAAFLFPLKVQNETIKKEIPFTLVSTAALLIVMSDIFLQGSSNNLITRGDGLILLLFFGIFMIYVFEIALKDREASKEASREDTGKTSESEGGTWGKNILISVIGLAAIIIGGEMVVSNATEIAYSLGMSETLVGLTIVAIGTSLPELVTSVSAALKKQSEIALGNIVGSNIFNILLVLGGSAFITPLAFDGKVFIDLFIMVILTLLLLVFSRTNYKIGKREGLILALAYVVYLIYIIIRN